MLLERNENAVAIMHCQIRRRVLCIPSPAILIPKHLYCCFQDTWDLIQLSIGFLAVLHGWQ